MNTFGYILNSSLVLIVLVQMRERKFDWTMIALPIAIVAVAAAEYLHSVPSGGNDALLEVVLVATGIALGALCGLFTSVRADEDGRPRVRAGYLAAVIWIVGVGARMAFVYASTHGSGPAIASFSRSAHITGGAAWTAALVMMGLVTVLARLAVLYARARRIERPVALPATGVAQA